MRGIAAGADVSGNGYSEEFPGPEKAKIAGPTPVSISTLPRPGSCVRSAKG